MLRLWPFMLVLICGTTLGVTMSQNPGYALFAYGNWSLEMPLWLAALFLILAIAVSLFSIWLISGVFSSSDKVKAWWKRHQENNARLQTYRGLLELTEGHWEKAEQYLIKGASQNDTPLINYLSAAKAAEESGSSERGDQYLKLALQVSTGSDLAVRLTQAQLQFKRGELAQSIATLQSLYKENPKQPQVLRLLCRLYETTHHWEALLKLLPALKKISVFSKAEHEQLEQKIYLTLLPQYAHQGIKPLFAFWQESPRSVQLNPVIVYEYAKLLLKHAAQEEAEVVVRNSLKKQWSQPLIYLYGFIQGRRPSKQLLFIEDFLHEHGTESLLLLTLGRLCIQNELWGKARGYLEKSLSLLPFPETYAALGQLMDKLGLTEKRDEYFKKGLLAATEHPGQPFIAALNTVQSYHPAQPAVLCLSDGT